MELNVIIRDKIDHSPMSRFQKQVVAICFVLNIIEGYDILVMSFGASRVAAEWTLSESQVGVLLSCGLIGMAVGSAALAPLADRIGRRPLTLVCLLITGVGMLVSAAAGGVVELALCRILTGLGIGGVVVSLPVLIGEYSNRRGRWTATALYAAGLPLGGVVGGLVAHAVGSSLGWRGTFVVGGAFTLVTLLAVLTRLPESLDYLTARQPKRALERLNVILARIGMPPADTMPEASKLGLDQATGTGRATTLSARTLSLWFAFFFMFAALYFAGSWTPRLLQESGLSPAQATNGGILLNAGGVLGAVVIAVIAMRASGAVLVSASLALSGLVFLLMSQVVGSLSLMLIVVTAVGFALNSNGATLFALAPAVYPAHVRATAVGRAVAVGRLGAILAPTLVGFLRDRGWGVDSLFLLFAGPLFLAAIGVYLAHRVTAAPAPSRETALS